MISVSLEQGGCLDWRAKRTGRWGQGLWRGSRGVWPVRPETCGLPASSALGYSLANREGQVGGAVMALWVFWPQALCGGIGAQERLPHLFLGDLSLTSNKDAFRE